MHSPGAMTGAAGSSQKTTPSASDLAAREKESGSSCHAFVILTLGAAGMACLMALLPAAGHDQMWCLYTARLMLHGAKLYGPQLFESNPPLIFWLSLAPEAMADWLHLPPTALGKLLVVALEAGVATLCLRMLRVHRPGQPKWVLWALAFVYVAVFAAAPARDFGQRDHILVLVCLPYVVAAGLRAEGRPLPSWQAVCVGLAAGVGIALKPHQALIPIAVESALLVLRAKWGVRLRLEPLAILAVGLAYLLAIRLFAADYLAQVSLSCAVLTGPSDTLPGRNWWANLFNCTCWQRWLSSRGWRAAFAGRRHSLRCSSPPDSPPLSPTTFRALAGTTNSFPRSASSRSR